MFGHIKRMIWAGNVARVRGTRIGIQDFDRCLDCEDVAVYILAHTLWRT